jgi:hypothetical protein
VFFISLKRKRAERFSIIWEHDVDPAFSAAHIPLSRSRSVWIGGRSKITRIDFGGDESTRNQRSAASWPAHVGSFISSILYLPRNNEVWTCGGHDISVWDPQSSSILATLSRMHESPISCMTLGEDVVGSRQPREEKEKEKSGKAKKKDEKEKDEAKKKEKEREKEEGKEKKRDREKKKDAADVMAKSGSSVRSKSKGSGPLVSSIGSDGVINLWDSDTRISLLRFRAIFGHEQTASPLVHYALSVRSADKGLNVWGGGERSAFVWSSSPDEKQADGLICREIVKNAKLSQVMALLTAENISWTVFR